MKTKIKLIGILSLITISVVMALYNFSNSSKDKKVETQNELKVEVGNGTENESTEDTIIDSNKTPSSNLKDEKPVWIKNLTFITDQGETMDIMLALKSKLNSQLKIIDKNIYEVTLKEDTYVKTDQGFKIDAKADKLNGIIGIEYNNYEFIFTIIE